MSLFSRVILLSGTPGVGKSTISDLLELQGYAVIRLNDLIISDGLYYGYDFTRESVIIDEELLREKLLQDLSNHQGLIFIEGHTVEFVPTEFVHHIILLRCNPGILRMRLQKDRNYSKEKIEENLQAEIMDECFLNLRQYYPLERITQIDTTEISPNEIVKKIIALILTLK